MPFTLLDVVLVLVLLAYLFHGLRAGFLVSLGGIAGFAVGATASFFAVPLVSQWVTSSNWRVPAVLLTIGLLLAVCSGVGARIGVRLRGLVTVGPIRSLDRIFGAVVNVVVASLVMSVLASALSAVGIPGVSASIASSNVLAGIQRATPTPVAESMAQLRSTLTTHGGIPQIIADNFDGAPVPVPDESVDTPALNVAAESVVRITGNALQCGQNQTGSGWVMSDDRVVTNAHVVAGVSRPVVEVPGSMAQAATVVQFDPQRDIAVLAVDGLSAPPLEQGAALPSGASAVVAGYPLGGPYQAKPAAIQSSSTQRVPNIYGTGTSARGIYQLAADVQQGNSGGPLLDTEGRVVGMIFARSRDNLPVGYALTLAQVRAVTDAAGDSEVSTGSCIQD